MSVLPHVLRTVGARARRHGALPDLSIPQLIALRAIAHGDVRPSDLARHTMVTLPAATSMVDTLVERGLVERARDVQDRRSVCLSITPEGTRLLEERQVPLNEAALELLARMTLEEQERLLACLQDLQRCVSIAQSNPSSLEADCEAGSDAPPPDLRG